MPNTPFLKEVDPEVDPNADKPLAADDTTTVEGIPEKDAPLTDENELFSAGEPERPEDDPEETGELFTESGQEVKTPKGWSDATYRRFKQVIGQRNQSRSDGALLRKDNAQLRIEAKANEDLKRFFDDKYGSFDNPLAIAGSDVAFMESLQEMSKTNMAAAQFADQVKSYQKTGSMPVSDLPNPTPTPVRGAPVAAEPKPDPNIAKLLEQNARRDSTAILADMDVKPSFQKLIVDHIVANAEDVTALDRAAVTKLAKDFIIDRGFTAKDVLATEPVAKKGKPPTGRQSLAVTGRAKPGTDDATDGRSEAPKTREEWLANRDSMLEGMVGGSD